MTENAEPPLSSADAEVRNAAYGVFSPKLVNLSLLLLLTVLLLCSCSLALFSPGLLDEQFLLAWLKGLGKLHGSSGFSGFMSFAGFEQSDGWGPTTKLSFCLLGMFFGKRLFFYKLFLLVLHGACSYLVFLSGIELSNCFLAAIFACLFFALFPLHFEATSWLGGAGMELGTLFYLLSLFIYLSARNKGVLNWFQIGTISGFMLVAVASSSILFSACLSFGLLELLRLFLPSCQAKTREDLSMSMIAVLLPVVLVSCYLAALGGISPALVPDLQIKNIVTCLRHMFLPVNELNWQHYSKAYRFLFGFYPFLAVALLRSFWGSIELRRGSMCSFLLFGLLAVPTLGIAMLDSSLYGERFLYAASAPFCIFLGSAAAGLGSLKGRYKSAGRAASVLLAVLLCAFFYRHLWNENAANRNAARVLKSLQKSMRILEEKEHMPLLVLTDLPEKISLAPLFNNRGPRVFDPQEGLLRSNPVPDGRLKDLLKDGQFSHCVWRWEKRLNCFLPLNLSEGKATWPEGLNIEGFSGRMQPAVEFYRNVKFNKEKNELVLESNSENGPMITLNPSELSTTDGDYLFLDALIEAPSSAVSPRIEMYWQTRIQDHYEKRERFTYADAICNDGKVHRYLLSLRSNGWTAGGVPTILALGFPAGSRVHLTGFGLLRQANLNLLPSLKDSSSSASFADPRVKHFSPPFYNYPLEPKLGLVPLSDQANEISAEYSVAEIVGASGVLLELSVANRAFDDANSNHLSGQTYKTMSMKGKSGRISIPISDLPGPGVYSIRVIGSDENGKRLGQFSDPLSYQVPVRKEN